MKKKLSYFLVAAVLVAVDQLTKALTRSCIPLGEKITLIPNVIGLTYVRNTGAAFSSFSNGTFLLALVSLLASVALGIAIIKEWLKHPIGLWILTVIFAGSVGNLIDRALAGYVTDMVDTLFMDFAVYNVADICVVLGAIAMAVYILFFYNRLEAPRAQKDNGNCDIDG